MSKAQRQAEQTAQQVEAMREFMRRFPDECEASAARWAVTGSVRSRMFPAQQAQVKALREAYAAVQ